MSESASPDYGALLKKTREAKRMKRGTLAALAGITPGHLYRVEQGTRAAPRQPIVVALARALNLDINDTNRHLEAAGYMPEVIHSQRPSLPDLDVVLEMLKDKIRQLPSETAAHAIKTLWGLRDVLHELPSASAESPFVAMKPISIGCIPIAGRQWRPSAAIRLDDIMASIKRTGWEAVAAGVPELVIILPSQKLNIVRDQLDADALAERVQLTYVDQPSPSGLGGAILQARDAIGDRSFSVLLPDDEILARENDSNRHSSGHILRRMIRLYRQQPPPCGIVAVVSKRPSGRPQGIARLQPGAVKGQLAAIEWISEKPATNDPKVKDANAYHVVGRYILPTAIFGYLDAVKVDGRCELTDALQKMVEHQGAALYGYALPLNQDTSSYVVEPIEDELSRPA